MQDRANLETLPYDILSSVFKSLDRSSLASACLSSHRINEVASENLYTSILFVISQDDSEAEGPLSAIKRRPSLKRVVQAILFKFKDIGARNLVEKWSLSVIIYEVSHESGNWNG
ncbi:hypothetical protein FRC19_010415 [Serendipita sp. 401]|nr:hypothetical protein FRC19_010415 [Serendipita sp. 401]